MVHFNSIRDMGGQKVNILVKDLGGERYANTNVIREAGGRSF